MKIVDVIQGTPEWHEARLGIPTASRFDKILTPKTMQLSKQIDGFLYELTAEWIIGESMETAKTEFMERGNELEEAAVNWYEFDQDCDTEAIGFVTSDDGRYGCSPDRFVVGANGGAEIKCPKPSTHLSYLLNPGTLEDHYRCQLQGCLWVCEREWWDIVCYNPSQYIPNIRKRVYRDDEFIAKLSTAVLEFCDKLDAVKAEAVAAGCVPYKETE